MTTTLPWHPLLCSKSVRLHNTRRTFIPRRSVRPVRAFGRSDFDGFAKRMASGEVLRDVWRSTNDGFEQFVYETKKTAERLDRRYSISRRLSAAAQSAGYRAKEIDRDLEITQRWRSFSLDFSQNWPRYRKQLSDFLDTPLGRSFAAIFFLWFALSGWMFRFLIFGTWILPFAGPLLIGKVANNFVIKCYCVGIMLIVACVLKSLKGSCPACKKQFAGYKNQIVRCASCGNIVWQPQGDLFSRGRKGSTSSSSSKSEPEIIDVEFEEK